MGHLAVFLLIVGSIWGDVVTTTKVGQLNGASFHHIGGPVEVHSKKVNAQIKVLKAKFSSLEEGDPGQKLANSSYWKSLLGIKSSRPLNTTEVINWIRAEISWLEADAKKLESLVANYEIERGDKIFDIYTDRGHLEARLSALEKQISALGFEIKNNHFDCDRTVKKGDLVVSYSAKLEQFTIQVGARQKNLSEAEVDRYFRSIAGYLSDGRTDASQSSKVTRMRVDRYYRAAKQSLGELKVASCGASHQVMSEAQKHSIVKLFHPATYEKMSGVFSQASIERKKRFYSQLEARRPGEQNQGTEQGFGLIRSLGALNQISVN